MAVYFFSGDSFFVHQTVQKQITSFSQKYGRENVFYFSDGGINFNEVKGMCLGGGLFSSTSLIVISGIPYSTENKPSEKEKTDLESFGDWLSNNHQHISNFIVFASPKPDSRTRFCKLLLTSDRCIKKEASVSKGQQLLLEELLPNQQQLGASLLEKYKDNSWLLFQEIQKIVGLQLFRKNPITQADIDLLAYNPITVDNFKLFDKIVTGTPQESLDAIGIAKNLGDDIYQFLGGLYRYLKGLTLCYCYKMDGYDSKSIASLIKYPPFTVFGFVSVIDHVKIEYIMSLIDGILDIEYSIKNGFLDPSLFWSKLVFLISNDKK